jgi:hypothetical protein
MQGQTVIVRAFGDELLVRKVWSVGQTVVYVTDEKNYDLLISDRPGVVPIGIPYSDVFKYDNPIKGTRFDVSKLKPWD